MWPDTGLHRLHEVGFGLLGLRELLGQQLPDPPQVPLVLLDGLRALRLLFGASAKLVAS